MSAEASSEKPYHLRVWQSFPKVKDFDRTPAGDVIWTSLKGPDQIEGHAQYVRERLVATEETKILRCVPPGCPVATSPPFPFTYFV